MFEQQQKQEKIKKWNDKQEEYYQKLAAIVSVQNIEMIEQERDQKLEEKQATYDYFIQLKETIEFKNLETSEERQISVKEKNNRIKEQYS